MQEPIPQEMQAIQIDHHYPDPVEAIRNLKPFTKPVPSPKKGEVLIRIEAAPCNPSDIMQLQGRYGTENPLPAIPGREGAGRVVAPGGGILGSLLVGKRVACTAKSMVNGTWAQYCITDATLCTPLRHKLSTEEGAMLFVNPATAYGLLAKAIQEGHRAGIQTAAASQLGRMLIQLAAKKQFPLINVVRREEQVAMLKKMGAETVLNSAAAGFEEALSEACNRLGATIAFEAVGGAMTGQVLSALPKRSLVLVYGGLSNQPCQGIDPNGLIFEHKRVEGFWLKNWVMQKNLAGKIRMVTHLQNLVAAGVLKSSVRKRLNLNEVVEGLLEYQTQMTEGKYLICPHQ